MLSNSDVDRGGVRRDLARFPPDTAMIDDESPAAAAMSSAG
jgi:hypothetical protein